MVLYHSFCVVCLEVRSDRWHKRNNFLIENRLKFVTSTFYDWVSIDFLYHFLYVNIKLFEKFIVKFKQYLKKMYFYRVYILSNKYIISFE